MRILLLANHLNTGGISTYLLTLIKGYVARGHAVFVATSGGECVALAEELGARHILVSELAVKCEFHPGLIGAGFRLSRLIKEHRIDVLHAQTRVTQFVSALAFRLSGRPYVATCHGFFRPHLGRLLFPLWGAGAIAISTAVARHLTKDLRISPARVAVVSNGVDAMRFQPAEPQERQALRARFGMDTTTLLVGIIARLSDVKGHCYLIEAMRELTHRMPGVKCLIIGEGPLDAELKAQVARLGLGASVVFSPVNGRPAELLPMFDVFALPSLQEGLGLSAMEALACGVPVVASRVGGLPEVVRDGETGLLVPPRDHLALANALQKVLLDKGLGQKFSRQGREWVRTRFSLDRMIDGTLAVYEKALKPHA